jgi:hypothetical protein
VTVETTIDEKLLFGLVEESRQIKGDDLTIAELLWILKTPCPDFLLARSAGEIIGAKIEGTQRTILFSTPVNICEDEKLERGGIFYSIKILGHKEVDNIKLVDVKASAFSPEPSGIHFFDQEVRQWYLKQRETRANLVVYRIQPDNRIRARHLELRSIVDKCKIIYVDTCHWIEMRRCLLNAPQKSEIYERILDLLRRLKRRGTILCPVSLPLFAELTRHKNENAQHATVKLMDELSDGVCLQSPNALLEMEIQRCVAEILLEKDAPDLLEWAWTKVGWLGGEELEAPSSLTPAQIAYLQTEFFDFVWQMTFEDVMRSMKDMPLPVRDNRITATAWFNAHADAFTKSGRPFDEVLKIQRRNVFLQVNFKKRFCDAVDMLSKRFPKHAQLAAERMKPLEKVDPFLIPTLQIASAIQAIFISSGHKFKENDINDLQHAAFALPYCDVFFCDRPLKHKLTTLPLRLDKAYSTIVIAKPADFLEYLLRIEAETCTEKIGD